MELNVSDHKNSWEPPVPKEPNSDPLQNLVSVQCAEGDCAGYQLDGVVLCKISWFSSWE